MLVWQDFPLQWKYARTIRKQAVRQAREAVDLLGHHPSIIAVVRAQRAAAGRRTTAARPIGASAAKHVLNQQLPSWNKSVLDRWVKRAFESADETRPVVAHSGVAPHLPQLDGTDSHLYFGWYYGDEADLAGFAATDAADGPLRQRVRRPLGAVRRRRSPTPSAGRSSTGRELTERYGYEPAMFERHVPPAPYPTFDVVARGHPALPGGAAAPPDRDAAPAEVPADRRLHPVHAQRRRPVDLVEPARPRARPEAGPPGRRRRLPAGDRHRRPAARRCVEPGDALALDVHVVNDLRRAARGGASARPRCAGPAAATSGAGRATSAPTAWPGSASSASSSPTCPASCGST